MSEPLIHRTGCEGRRIEEVDRWQDDGAGWTRQTQCLDCGAYSVRLPTYSEAPSPTEPPHSP